MLGGQKINLPNKLTVFRIMLVPIVVIFLFLENLNYRYLFSCIIFLIASYTDHLDGKLARKNNIVTNFGKIMDPLADKILITSILICFVGAGFVSSLAAVIIVAREFMVTSLRFLVFQNNGKVISANIFGKLKTISQTLAILFIFLIQSYLEFFAFRDHPLNSYMDSCFLFQDILVWTSVIFSCLSGAMYAYSSRNYIVFDS